MRLFVRGRPNLLCEFVNFGDDVGNFSEGAVQLLSEAQTLIDDSGTAIHVFDCFTRLFLDALNQLRNFFGGLCRLFGQLADLIRYNGEPKAVLAGTRCLDGGV